MSSFWKSGSFLFVLGLFPSLYSSAQQDGPEELVWEETNPSFATGQVPFSLQEPQIPALKFPSPSKNSFFSVGLSSLIPGLGHVYLGDMKVATSLLGSTLAAATWANLSKSEESKQTSLLALQTTWSYGIFAAYRDTQVFNHNVNLSYKIPTDSFTDLAFAPFKFSILKKPSVWGGLLGMLGVAATIGYLAFPEKAYIQAPLSTNFPSQVPLLAFPVGLGEEALFRGYLQSQLANLTTPWCGITLSSIAFGAAHIFNASLIEPEYRMRYYSVSLPLITAFGAYFGYLTYKSGSLQESVALHAWYDFFIFAANSLATHAAVTGRPGFAMSLSF